MESEFNPSLSRRKPIHISGNQSLCPDTYWLYNFLSCFPPTLLPCFLLPPSVLFLCLNVHTCFLPPSPSPSLPLFFFFFLKIYLLYITTLLLSSDTPEEGIRSHYRWLWATMWLLGIELRTSGRAVGALNHWAISPAPKIPLLSPFVSLDSRNLLVQFHRIDSICL